MTVTINGTTGIAGANGSASTPAVQGEDTNTGVFFPAADTVAVATGGSERLRVDSSGNVGIGTTSPTSLGTGITTLELKGNSASQTDRAGGINFMRYDGNPGMYVYHADDASYISSLSTYPLLIQTNGTERARIDSSGNLLVGTTSQSNNATLTVSGTVSASLNGRIYSLGTYNNTTASSANVHIASDGHFFRSTSSLKYKRDVQNAAHGLTELLALRPVTYKGQAQSDGDTVYGGLIAEEVHEAGLTEFVQYAEDGSPDALAYGNMVSLCIKAIQEQQATITVLEARIATLEAAQ